MQHIIEIAAILSWAGRHGSPRWWEAAHHRNNSQRQMYFPATLGTQRDTLIVCGKGSCALRPVIGPTAITNGCDSTAEIVDRILQAANEDSQPQTLGLRHGTRLGQELSGSM